MWLMTVLFVVAALLVAAAVIFQVRADRMRREAMAGLAARLGLRFDPADDRDLPVRYRNLHWLQEGDNRRARNCLSGSYRGHEVLAFDYHYETRTTDSEGQTHTQDHALSVLLLFLPRSFPELVISREGWASKVAQGFGFDDIDFESAEFSRRFCVRSHDKRFAYDICHARMIEYLLANPDLDLEIEDNVLAIGLDGLSAPPALERDLDRLRSVRDLFPAYVLKE